MKLSNNIKDKAIQKLNEILELEMSGVVRYTHYSLMIIGHNMIPNHRMDEESGTRRLKTCY
jgi:bacterioferritin